MDSDIGSSNAVTVRAVTVVSIASFAYLLFSAVLVGFKSDQVVLVILFNLFNIFCISISLTLVSSGMSSSSNMFSIFD